MAAQASADADQNTVYRDFKQAVNMTPAALQKWLKTDASKEVGFTKDGDHESVGHHSGRRIVELLRKNKSDLDDDDVDHMRKVIGYVHRHLAQRPEGDVGDTRWRWSLMNWGHDPLKG
jgi:hypothetical protein